MYISFHLALKCNSCLKYCCVMFCCTNPLKTLLEAIWEDEGCIGAKNCSLGLVDEASWLAGDEVWGTWWREDIGWSEEELEEEPRYHTMTSPFSPDVAKHVPNTFHLIYWISPPPRWLASSRYIAETCGVSKSWPLFMMSIKTILQMMTVRSLEQLAARLNDRPARGAHCTSFIICVWCMSTELWC